MPVHPIGLIHLVAAMFALTCGTLVLVQPKGTLTHKRWGYAYVFSMTVMLATSFLIYRLFRGFGLFHGFAVIASATLTAGFVPALRRKPDYWIDLHFGFMYWSVIGLYSICSGIAHSRPEDAIFRHGRSGHRHGDRYRALFLAAKTARLVRPIPFVQDRGGCPAQVVPHPIGIRVSIVLSNFLPIP
jgi:Predicted membrane protein (DUF2306)